VKNAIIVGKKEGASNRGGLYARVEGIGTEGGGAGPRKTQRFPSCRVVWEARKRDGGAVAREDIRGKKKEPRRKNSVKRPGKSWNN